MRTPEVEAIICDVKNLGCSLKSNEAYALAAEVERLETQLMRQEEIARTGHEAEVARHGEERMRLEAQNARLRGDLEYAEAERRRLTARRDALDTQIAALTDKNARLKEVLVDCHAYLMCRITLLTLNESASDTTQSLAREVSVALDAIADGKATP